MKKYFFSAFVILIFIFLFKLFFSNRFMPLTSGYRGFVHEKKVDYLFIGSSQTRQGLNQNTLEDSLGNIYLLAYNANSFYYMDFLLNMIKEENRLPKTVVIEANPFRTFLKKEVSDIRLFNDLNYHYKFEFLKTSKDVLSAWDMYELVMLSGNEGIVTYPLLYKFLNSLSYKGGYTNKFVPGMTAEKFTQISLPVSDTVTYTGLDRMQIAALKRILLFAKNNDVNLVFLEPPTAKKISESSLFKQAQADLEKIIEDAGVAHKYVSPVDYKINESDPAIFNDGFHLSTAGRDIYTSSVIPFLR